MRRGQEVKEDDPFMASICQHAQSKLMCIALEETSECVGDIVFVYLLYLLFQENKSFGASTICIHPLMQKKLCREQFIFSGTPDNRQPTDNGTRMTERTTEGNRTESGLKVVIWIHANRPRQSW